MGLKTPTVVERKFERISPWVTLVSKKLIFPGESQPKDYHSLAQSDYVTVLGITQDGYIPLVRQYRPALECLTWELPGGLLDEGERPQDAARRELFEETGYRLAGEPVMLGRLAPDAGRLEKGL